MCDIVNFHWLTPPPPNRVKVHFASKSCNPAASVIHLLHKWNWLIKWQHTLFHGEQMWVYISRHPICDHHISPCLIKMIGSPKDVHQLKILHQHPGLRSLSFPTILRLPLRHFAVGWGRGLADSYWMFWCFLMHHGPLTNMIYTYM